MIKKINVNFSFSSITRNISKIIDKNMEVGAEESARQTKKNILKGLKPELKESTIKVRRAMGITGNKPLLRTRSLYESIIATKGKLEMNEYGILHQEGFEWTPPRPFISLDEGVQERVIRDIKEEIVKGR